MKTIPEKGCLKRFYKNVSVNPCDSGFSILLDGRLLKTPAKRDFIIPSAELAEIISREWLEQTDRIEPETMPFTRIVNSALDGTEQKREEVAADILRYAGSDLLCYRVLFPVELAEQQKRHWDSVLSLFEEKNGIRFNVTHDLAFIEQDAAIIGKIRMLLQDYESPLRLSALHMLTTLSGSAVLALSIGGELLRFEDAWQMAHLDESYQEQNWGHDEEALNRRNAHFRDFKAAAILLNLAMR